MYKSQGRKSFETDTPNRVPIALIFHCRPTRSLDTPAQMASLDQLKHLQGLAIRQTIYQNTVILLASTTQPDLTCISEGLDLENYTKNLDILPYQINTWP